MLQDDGKLDGDGDSEIRTGAVVVACGLKNQKATKHNGRSGLVCKFHADKDRCDLHAI